MIGLGGGIPKPQSGYKITKPLLESFRLSPMEPSVEISAFKDEAWGDMAVSPIPPGIPRALPDVTCEDEVFERLYERVYRRTIRAQKRYKPWPKPASNRACLVAEYVLWMMIPAEERPASWPKDMREFSDRTGAPIQSIRSLASRVRAHELIEKSPFGAKALVESLTRKVYDRAVADLRDSPAGSTGATKAAELYLRAQGAIQGVGRPGTQVNVNLGPTLNVNGAGQLSREELVKELAAMNHYAALSGLVSPEVRDAEVEEAAGSRLPEPASEELRGTGRSFPEEGHDLPPSRDLSLGDHGDGHPLGDHPVDARLGDRPE